MSSRQGSQGSLLIITLWLVTILGALSVAVARYLSTEVRLTRYRLARQEARELARSGVSLALALLQQDQEETPTEDWSGDLWAVPQEISPAPGRRLTVTVTDEERRLNVNTATAAQLSRLLGDGTLAQTVADYRVAKNGPVAALEELSGIPDMTAEAYGTLSAVTTPFTSLSAIGGPLNLNTVERDVLEAVGLRSGTIQTILQYRSGTEHFVQTGAELISFLESQGLVLDDMEERTVLASPLFTVSSQSFRVVSEGAVESPDVRVRVQAVILRGASDSVPTIIAWKEG